MSYDHPDSSFRPHHMPDATDEYVAWIDLMGTKIVTSNVSPRIASVNICKLYDAAIRAELGPKVKGYPMGDGMFLTSPDGDALYSKIEQIFSDIATEIVKRNRHDRDFELLYMPVLKGVITQGEVYHGSDIEGSVLNGHDFMNNLVFGKPLVSAIEMEVKTPPFGLTFHESASPTSERKAYQWWSKDSTSRDLWEVLEEYYTICMEYSKKIGYSVEKIKEHRERAKWYLRET